MQFSSDFNIARYQEELEWLRERVSSLQEALSHQAQEKQSVEQELNETYRELESQELELMKMQQILNARQLTLKQAIRIANYSLRTGETTKEAIARLLSAIYDEDISVSSLEETEMSSK